MRKLNFQLSQDIDCKLFFHNPTINIEELLVLFTLNHPDEKNNKQNRNQPENPNFSVSYLQ